MLLYVGGEHFDTSNHLLAKHIPKCNYYRDPWIKISKLLGGIPVRQAKRETQSKTCFIGLIRKNLTSGESNSEGL